METSSLDNWTFFFLIAAFQGIMLSLFIFKTPADKHPGKNYLATAILFFSIMLCYYVAFWTGYSQYLNRFGGFFMTFPFLLGPLMLLYSQRKNQVESSRNQILHFIPFLAHTLFFLISYFTVNSREAWIALTNIFNGIFVFQCIHLIAYAAMIIRQMRAVRNQWNNWIAFSFLAFTLLHASYYVMLFSGKYELFFDYLISVSMCVLIYGIAYFGLTFTHIQQKKNSSPLLTKASTAYYSDTLKQLMDNEKPYLEGDLKLKDLADKIGLNTHALSQLLNDHFQKSYSDFINGYRIKEAERILSSDKSDPKVIEIAYQCGFNTKASFYNAFKKKNEITPLEYRELILRQKVKV